MLGLRGLIVSDCRVMTVMVVESDTFPCLAEIVVTPEATALARPDEAIVATAVLEDAHVTLAVMLRTDPSE